MIGIILIVSLLVTSAIAKSQCDRKAFKEGGVEPSDGKGWLRKTVLSFTLGKWHRWDAVRNMAVSLIAVIALGWAFYWAIAIYFVIGLIFEILYSMG